MHIPRLDELLVREPVLVILDGSERPRPRVRGFASAIENRVGSWKGLGLGERDALGVELSQVAAADGVVLVFVAGGALLAHLLPVREGGLVGGDSCGDGGVLGRTSLVEGEVGVVGDEGAPVLEERHGEVAVGSREGGVDVAPAHLGRQLRLEPREVAERLGRGVGASNALKGLADAVVRKLESLARDIGRRDAGNVLGLCAGNPLDEVEAELRGVRDAVSVDDRVDDVEWRKLLPEVRGELLLAGFRVAKEGADGLEAVHSSLDDPAGGLGVVGVVVVGALEAEWVPIGGGEVQVVAVGGRQPQGPLGLDKADEAGRAHDEASDG